MTKTDDKAKAAEHPCGQPPSVGRTVLFQTDGRGGKRYHLPAIITTTTDSHPDADQVKPKELAASEAVGVHGNPVPVPNTAKGVVHLHVMTPGPKGYYTELAVPFDDSETPAPRTWRWPARV